jgi:hypothetical protein
VQRSLETAFVNASGGWIPSLQWGVRERPDSAQKQTYANLADSSIASATSGISSDGEKPSSAGARTAWASAGRPVIGRRLPLRALRAISRSQSNDGYGADTGPSRGDPRRRASRPIEPFAVVAR